MTRQALDRLGSGHNDRWRRCARIWCVDTLARDPDELNEGEEPATADAEGLRRFLEADVLPWFEARYEAHLGPAEPLQLVGIEQLTERLLADERSVGQFLPA